MNIPSELLYTKSHEWVEMIDETTARVGLTDFAQHSLGDLVFVNLPEEGDAVSVEESFADVESVKAVSDIFSPFEGEIAAINEALLDVPEQINTDPYGAWLVEIRNITDKETLLSAGDYEKICVEEE